jgi:hypothetical protein
MYSHISKKGIKRDIWGVVLSDQFHLVQTYAIGGGGGGLGLRGEGEVNPNLLPI